MSRPKTMRGCVPNMGWTIRSRYAISSGLAVWRKGDLGTSFVSKQPVINEIGQRLPNTLLLMGVALLVTLLIAVPLGVISALRQYSVMDTSLTALAFAGNSLPVFWFGLLLIMVFSVWLGWFPGSGMTTLGKPFSLLDLAWHMVLPVTMLALGDGGRLYALYAVVDARRQSRRTICARRAPKG